MRDNCSPSSLERFQSENVDNRQWQLTWRDKETPQSANLGICTYNTWHEPTDAEKSTTHAISRLAALERIVTKVP